MITPVLAVALAAAAFLALRSSMGTDYPGDAGPSMDALLRFDLGTFFGHQPQMGQLSLWLRWPAAALGDALGGALGAYRAGALVCLLAPVALAAWLAAGSRSESTGLLAVVALVANPVVARALHLGHPEEALGAALCAAAVLLALQGRASAGGVALGLALATKQWALLAVGPVLLAAPAPARVRLVVVAGAIAAAWTVPALVADPGAFLDGLRRPATGLHELRPGNVWSLLLGSSAHVGLGGGESVPVTFAPGWLRATAHPAVIVVGAALPLLWWRRGRGGAHPDALALLALIFLLRCAIDPWNHEYYHLPFLAALACWEVVRGRAPVLAAASTALLWLVFDPLAQGSGTSDAADAVYVAWAAVAAAGLAVVLWRPARTLAPRRHAAAARS